MLVKLTGQQLAYLMHSVTEHQSPFKLVDVMSLKMDMIVEEMDLSTTLGKICEELVEKHGMEEWSAKVLNYTTRIAIYEVLRSDLPGHVGCGHQQEDRRRQRSATG